MNGAQKQAVEFPSFTWSHGLGQNYCELGFPNHDHIGCVVSGYIGYNYTLDSCIRSIVKPSSRSERDTSAVLSAEF